MTEISAFDSVTESAPAVDTSTEVTTDSGEPTPALAETAPAGEEVTDVSQEAPAEEEISDEEIDRQVQEVLDNPKSNKVYKNLFGHAKKSFEKRQEAFKPLADLGEVESVVSDVEFARGLHAIETVNGRPAPSVKGFVDELVKRGGEERAVDIALHLMDVKSADGSTIADELFRHLYGLDPSRIGQLREFAAQGYQVKGSDIPETELALIPEHLREAYSSLTPAERERLDPSYDSSEADKAYREGILANKQRILDYERAETERQAAEARQKEQSEADRQREFNDEIATAAQPLAIESGSRIVDGFVADLTGQTGLTESEGFDLAVRIQQAIGGQGAIAEKAKTFLKADGVEIDPKLVDLVEQVDQQAGLFAYFSHPNVNKPQEAAHAKSKLADIERNIQIHAKKIIAAVAKSRATLKAERGAQHNRAIDASQKFNTGVSPNTGSQPGIPLGQIPGVGEPQAFD